jgi:exoribonuclease R
MLIISKNMLKLEIADRNYTSWKYGVLTHPSQDELPNPLTHMFLHEDVINEKGELIIPSPFRTNQMIPGILVLENSKTYGRSNDKGRLLYKCIPDSHHLPNFIVPYDNKCIQFRKRPLNKYVLFCFKEWKDKHPVGMITHILGDVDKLEVFYEYQLHCKSLMDSIKDFNKYTLSEISTRYNQEKMVYSIYEQFKDSHKIEDRREHVIFSIDPEGCKDIDDAMGIVTTPTGYIISIYIANVTLWMEALKLWNVFSERISTIYLPDRRVSMLPTILSENYASLKEGNDRFAFCMDLHISRYDCMIEKIEYKNVLIKLDRNYVYDEKALLENPLYKKIMEITKELTQITNYLDTVTDSHEVVEFWMIMMNNQCGILLECHKTGLFRTKQHDDDTDREIDIDIENKNIFKIWNSTSAASYCSFENNKGHDMIGKTGLDTYVHITSPIRRLVDLINITTIQKKLGLMKCSDECERFLTKWYSRIDYINQKMKAIKRVQNDCSLLYLCSSGTINMEEEMECYVWCDNDNMNIYIPSIKWITNIRVETDKKYKNYSLQKCKVFVINDEVSLKRKVRIMIL